MAPGPSRTYLRLWLRLLAATSEMERALRSRLRKEFETTLPRFDTMAALERAPEGLSMSELSRRLMVTNGNTTPMVVALERDGIVAREVCPTDRRSFTVRLTAKGQAMFVEMAAAHAKWVAELLGGIADSDAEQLSRLLHDVRLEIERRTGYEEETT